jgi:hypothetical protein
LTDGSLGRQDAYRSYLLDKGIHSMEALALVKGMPEEAKGAAAKLLR